MTRFDVLVLGDYCYDLIFTDLPSLPVLGSERVAGGLTLIPGGAYNTAVAMHRLGMKVGWAADFGEDAFSRFVLEHLRDEQLEDSLFVHHARPLRRVTVALSFPADRAFVAFYDPPPSFPAAIKALAVAHASAVYVEGLYVGHFMEPALRMVRAKGMKIIMDGNTSEEMSLKDPAVAKVLKAVDVFLPNAQEACHLAGVGEVEEATLILAKHCSLAVVKDGGRGAFSAVDGRLLHVPALPVNAVETTGAGDTFNAGFTCAWLEGRPLEECLRWGNIVGGLSTLAPGGTGQRVARSDVETWLRKQYSDATKP